LKLLLIHADVFEYEVKEKALPHPEEVNEERKKLKVNDVLVVFTTVEKDDEDDIDYVIAEASKAIEEVYNKVSPSAILIYPYAHLSTELASPSKALEALRRLEDKVRERGYVVFRAPFGWYKAFTLRCKGHPLSELSRTIKVKERKIEVEKEEETAEKSEYRLIEPDGTEHHIVLERIDEYEVLDKYPLLKQFILCEELGKKPHRPPEHIRLMRKLELVDYEPASDIGHFRFYPKGELIKDLLEEYATQIAIKDIGAMKIGTPMLYKLDEPDIAEQAAKFRERDYRLKVGGREFVLRFAGDFGLFRMMKTTIMTYRQLPVRMYELAPSFRLEQSGECVGLRRLRAFTMPDIHCFCRDLKQGMEEYARLFKYYAKLADAMGIDYVVVFRVVKSFYEENKEWIKEMVKGVGKPALIELLPRMKHYWIVKHEFQFVDSVGGNAQLSTVQLDIEDSERYGIYYVDEHGEKRGCIIVHSSMGSIERWIYAMLEQAAKDIVKGRTPKLPTWLSPIQVRIIPVSSEYLKHAIDVADALEKHGFRADVDDREETVSAKIRSAETEWIPYVVVIGKKEISQGVLSVRIRGKGIVEMKLEELVKRLEEEVGDKPRLPLYTPKFLSLKPRFV